LSAGSQIVQLWPQFLPAHGSYAAGALAVAVGVGAGVGAGAGAAVGWLLGGGFSYLWMVHARARPSADDVSKVTDATRLWFMRFLATRVELQLGGRVKVEPGDGSTS
jgi:hypothetical protein